MAGMVEMEEMVRRWWMGVGKASRRMGGRGGIAEKGSLGQAAGADSSFGGDRAKHEVPCCTVRYCAS